MLKNESPSSPPKIAILMPIYNGSEFFEESFSSIILQSYKNWQLWIGINGHSIDGVVYNKIKNIIKPFANERDIMLLDFGLPGNKSATLNALVKLLPVTIRYVALLDVDDIWYPNKLEMQIPLLQKAPQELVQNLLMGSGKKKEAQKASPPYHVVGTRCQYFGEGVEPVIPFVPIGDFTMLHNFKNSNPIINSSVIIYRPLANWSEDTQLEDFELWLKLRRRGDVKFYNCPEVLVKHRIHDDSAFNTTNTQYVEELLEKF
jgi:teichuronic acid biosynthesis glycosyltransferase TuaG